jgi:hypothetical protein
LKDNSITVRYKDATIALSKQGLYRLDADAGRLRVYDGEASATVGLKTVQVHKGKQVELDDALLATSFDVKDTDAFYRWVSRRSEYIAAANVSSARAAGTGGLNASNSVPCVAQPSTSANPSFATSNSTYCNPYGDPYGYGNGYPYGPGYGYSPYGMWAWNPYFGVFTYLPGMGYGYSPFGWAIYSPSTVGTLYVPGAYRGSGATPVVNNRGSGPTALAGSTRATGSASSTAASALRGSGSSGVSSSSGGRVSSSGGGVSGGSVSSAGGGGGRGGGGGGGAHR